MNKTARREGRRNVLPEVAAQNPIAVELEKAVPGSVVDFKTEVDGPVIFVSGSAIIAVAKHLRETAGFVRLSSITAVDSWPRDPRFEVIYFLHSLANNARIRVVVRAKETDSIESVSRIWRSANWYEREVFDLFGVQFFNHPNLERIMMPADWEGYPLRKDYPIHGYKYSYQDE
jgi:NADH-quinone oxidoreductase subunit C